MTLSPIVEFAPFRLDVLDERLWRGQEVLPLTPKAFAVLRCLVAHPRQRVTKATLMDTVWPETAISESTLTGCIWEVRQALGDSARHPRYLETAHGRGYRFIALVTGAAAPEAPPPAAVEQPQVSQVPALPVACLVGREAELAQLAQWYETARQGQRRVGLIGGEPGIGKSALVEVFVAQVAAKAPVWIAHGQCIEQYGAGEPYLPILEGLGRLCRGPDGEAIVAILRQVAPSWLVHLPAVVSTGDREALTRLMSGVTPARMMIPESLKILIEQHVEQLSLNDQRMLEAASVAGVEFAATAVAAGLAQADEIVEARCLALAQQGRFLQASGRAEWPDGTVTACYRFRHALYQEIVYRRLPAGCQSHWHARIGTRLAHGFGEHAGEMAAAVAWHCVQGRLLPQAVPYLWQAGRQAMQRGASQEAVAFYEQALVALQRLSTTSDRLAHAIDLHLALDEALFSLDAFDRVYDTLQAAERLAERLEDPRRLGWVNEALSTSFRRLGTYDQAVAAAQRARLLATTVGGGALQAWATCRLGQAAYFLGDYARAINCFQEVISSPPEQTKDVGTLMVLPAHGRSWLVYCLTQRGEFDEGLTLGAEAVRIAESGAFPTSQCAAYASLADAFLVRGAFPSAIALLERGLDICRRWHNLDWFPEYATSLGLAYAQGGRMAEALPLLEQAVAQETTIGGGHRVIGLMALSHGYRLAGRLEAAQKQAENALSLARERQECGFQAWALRLLGEIAAHDTPPKIEPARAAYQQALALAEELGMRPLQAHCHRGLGTLYRQIGQSEKARAKLSTAIEMYRGMAMTF